MKGVKMAKVSFEIDTNDDSHDKAKDKSLLFNE